MDSAAHAKLSSLNEEELQALIKEAFANTTHPNGDWSGGVFIRSLPEFKGKRPRRWGYELHGNIPGANVVHGNTEVYDFDDPEGVENDYVNASGPYSPTP